MARHTYSLQSGQSLHLHVAPGTHIVALSGSIDVVGPAEWLAESVVSPSMRLHEGDVHVVAQSGMLTVASRTGGDVLCVPLPRRVPAALGWLGAVVKSIRRQFAPAKTAARATA